jgi:hypothetical protein
MPPSVFFSYAHEDEAHRDALSTSLAMLRRLGRIREWHDRRITAGQQWRAQIMTELEAADVILLLVSPDFLASDFVWGEEVAVAMRRHQAGTARVVPIIIRPSNWQPAPFGSLQALPTDGKPVTLWRNRDSAWLAVTEGISAAVDDLLSTGPIDPGPTAQPSIVSEVPTAPHQPRGRPVDATPGSDRTCRAVHDAGHGTVVPGRPARLDGDPPTGDPAVDETFEAMGATDDLFRDVYGLDGPDGAGGRWQAVVHYENAWMNTAWNGQWLLVGDGDGSVFTRFSACTEIIGHELAHAVLQYRCPLTFWGESGSLIESIADVFGTLVRQYGLRQTVTEADWLMGAGLLAPGVDGLALRSLSDPGGAYDDPVLGKDPQPAHLRQVTPTTADNGGVHINCGIPNRAFHLAAIAIGGHAWERAGSIWYAAAADPELRPDSGFRDFAAITRRAAGTLFGAGSDELLAVEFGWRMVGVEVPR